MKKGTRRNPAIVEGWFIMGTGYAGEVTNHPRQNDFDKRLQIIFPQQKDLKGSKQGDTCITDGGVHFVLGERYET